ncbi:MAG: glucose dehydrogenase [Armatimonadetes bacterium]|nr:MAG: glucose dehydrogenase [Armatimonadota bacterium]
MPSQAGIRGLRIVTVKPFAFAVVGLGLAVVSCTSSPVPGGQTSTTIKPPVVTTAATTPSTSTTSTTQPEPSTTTTIPLENVALRVEEIDIGFSNPVLLVADPGGGSDLVVEQTGTIVKADGAGHEVVLVISSDVVFGGEQGLLGLAFHPQHATNHLAYVAYVGEGPKSIVEQFEVVDGVFDTASRRVILEIDQPASNHNGGMIAFGPDGYLWIGMGDGGAANDRFGNGQDPTTLLGAMLRIAVGVEGVERYGIPADNPYADGSGGAPEVWAIGLRNPWRFAFDGDDVWIADVGQNDVEEVNVTSVAIPNLNYGWPIMEGSSCFRSGCEADGLTLPIAEYSHNAGCSVTGGVVYRGDLIPSLRGQFMYSDYCSGRLWSVSKSGVVVDWSPSVGPLRNPTGFGTGSDGEVYIVTQTGTLLKITTEGG